MLFGAPAGRPRPMAPVLISADNDAGFPMRSDPREFMVCGSCRGQVPRFLLSTLFGGGAGVEAGVVIAGLDDVAMMGEAVQHGCRHRGVAKHASPFAEAPISKRM